MLTVIYDDQNTQMRGHTDRRPCNRKLGVYCAGNTIFFSGKFRRALQLDQSLSKDKSEMTISYDQREI